MIRQQLEIINRRELGYPLPIAEKDYFLAIALNTIYSSDLEDRLLFKGGTALHHCYLSQKRFSEDLDFTALDKTITLAEIVSVMEANGEFKVTKEYQSEFTIKIEKLRFEGLLGQNGHIKFEIDRFQNAILPGKTVEYKNVWGVKTHPLVMDEREICAEKIRAASQRVRYRDFYDLYFLLEVRKVGLKEAVVLLQRKEARTPIIAANIQKNWLTAKKYKNQDLENIFCSDEIADEAIETLIRTFKFDDIPANVAL
jgi:predicted nucleotidyltransferase component of viral defense system